MDESEIVYSLNYRSRISTLSERPVDFPGFYQVVGELNGYDDLQGIVNIPITDRVATGFEVQVHDAESTALGSANRDFTRYGVSLDVDKIAKHYNARIILEFWDASEGESEKTVSGEVSRNWAKAEVIVGVDYDRFQDRILLFDPFSLTDFVVESRDDLYSLFASLRYTFNEQHSSRVRVSVEDDDTDDAPYWRLHASHTIQF